MSCDYEELADVDLFALLDEDELRELAAVVDSRNGAENEIIFREGDPGESLFIVRYGQVELFVEDNSGQKIVLTVAEKNDFFGDLSMLDNRPRSASAVCLEDTELLVLDREDLLLLFNKKPDSALNM